MKVYCFFPSKKINGGPEATRGSPLLWRFTSSSTTRRERHGGGGGGGEQTNRDRETERGAQTDKQRESK